MVLGSRFKYLYKCRARDQPGAHQLDTKKLRGAINAIAHRSVFYAQAITGFKISTKNKYRQYYKVVIKKNELLQQ